VLFKKFIFWGSAAVAQSAVKFGFECYNICMKCVYHACSNNIEKQQRRFCSPQCKRKYFVDKRRKDIKRMSIEYKGGACQLRGYNKCESALVFHHTEPEAKDFGVSAKGYTRSWGKVKGELDKCLLLCSNCHAEIHARQLSRETEIEKLGEFGERFVGLTPSQALKGLSFKEGVETRE